MLRITHLREKCIGCYYCVEIAPDLWEIDEADGKALLSNAASKKNIYSRVLDEFERERCMNLVEICPVGVIKVEAAKLR